MRKVLATLLVLITTFSIFSFSTFTGNAVVEVLDGSFSYVKKSDETFALYHYYGNDTSIELPREAFGRKVTSIYTGAFEDSNLVSVIIPENYTVIEENAFFGCDSLTSVTFPSSLTKIGDNSFSGCSALCTVYLPNDSDLIEIGYAAFSGAANLGEFSFPSGIKTINSNAFSNTALTEANVPNSVISFGEGVFRECSSLESATLPVGLTKIPDNTFMGCTELTSIDIPEMITEIGNKAFYNCLSLTLNEFPTTLEKIGDSAFENATSLNELFISDGVTSIGTYAFYPMSIQNTLTVTCYENSYASEYCYENWVNYETVEKKLGDANLDGTTDILDVTFIQMYKIGKKDFTTYRARELADVNKDGLITIRDATLIQMKLAKIIDSF